MGLYLEKVVVKTLTIILNNPVLLEQKEGQNHNLILANEYTKYIAEFKYLGTKLRSHYHGNG